MFLRKCVNFFYTLNNSNDKCIFLSKEHYVRLNTRETFEMDEETDKDAKKITKIRTLVAYWLLGLCNNYGYVVMLSAAKDIIAKQNGEVDEDTSHEGNTERDCNYVSTGAILLADILPSLLIKLIAPFIPFYIHIRVACCVLFASTGFLLVAFSTGDWMAILGVIFTSFCAGLGEASFLQYSSFYNKNVISTWSSGTGAAGVIGAGSYVILNTLGFQTALLIMLSVPALMAISFWLLLPKPDEESEIIQIQMNINKKEVGEAGTSFTKKIRIIPRLSKYILALSSVYLFEYFINQGTFELINYDDIFIDHSAQYRWLQVDYQIGVFLSRSSVNLIHVRKLWIFSFLQFINVIIFTTEAIYYYIPSFYVVLVLTLWEGLLGGGSYVNTFYAISNEVPEDEKQFSLACTSFSDSIGISVAGIIAIFAHNGICKLPKPNRL